MPPRAWAIPSRGRLRGAEGGGGGPAAAAAPVSLWPALPWQGRGRAVRGPSRGLRGCWTRLGLAAPASGDFLS